MEARDAVGALARHVVLKVPDKADWRALAASAAAELVVELPTPHQHTFIVFITRLSRTPKACSHANSTPLVPDLTAVQHVSAYSSNSIEHTRHVNECIIRLRLSITEAKYCDSLID